MFYVTAVAEYPIYEPAEGGYYYAGTEIVWQRTFADRRKAKRFFNKTAREFQDEFEDATAPRDHLPYRNSVNRYNRDGCYMKITHDTQYVGEGHRLIMSNRPYVERGYVPYE